MQYSEGEDTLKYSNFAAIFQAFWQSLLKYSEIVGLVVVIFLRSSCLAGGRPQYLEAAANCSANIATFKRYCENFSFFYTKQTNKKLFFF